MNKTIKSLASLFVVMAMVISMIPTSFIITASAITVPAEGLTFSLKKSDSGSGPDIYTNWSSEYSGKFIDSSTQNYQAGYQNNDYAQVKEYVQFDSSKTYTFTLDVALYDENATRDMPELQIGGSTVTQFTQAQITQAMRDNHSSLPSGYAWESSYFTYQATYTYTPSDNNSKQIKLIFKHNDKDKVGFKSLTISEGGSGGGGGGGESNEVLIDTITMDESWSWQTHTIGTVDFTGYENIRFEATALKGEFNKLGVGNSGLMYLGSNKTSQNGKLDGTTVINGNTFPDVTNTANVEFTCEGNGQTQIIFYGTPIGGGGTTYTVNFSGTNGTVTATVGGNAINSGDSVSAGASVTFTATPSAGYAFSQWNDGNNTNPRTVTVNANTTMTATFTAVPTYTVNFSGTNGTVTATAGGNAISSGDTVAEGTSVTFTATPSPGYEFTQWSDNSTENPHTVTVNANTTMTATFTEQTSGEVLITTLTSTESGGGRHTLGTVDFTNYTDVRFEMTSTNTQYGFNRLYINNVDHWFGDTSSRSGKLDGTESYTNVTGLSDVLFEFQGWPTTTITFYGVRVGGDTPSGATNTLTLYASDDGVTGNNIQVYGNSKTAHYATGDNGVTEKYYNNPDSGEQEWALFFDIPTYSSNVDYTIDVYARTQNNGYINVWEEGYSTSNGSMTNDGTTYGKMGNNSVSDGSWTSLGGTAVRSYSYTYKTDGTGTIKSGKHAIGVYTQGYLNFYKVVITASENVFGATTPTTYTVTIGSAENGSASADTNEVEDGEDVTVTATPASHYHLSDWLVDGVSIGDDTNPLVYTPEADVEITPVFAIDTFTVSLTAGDHGSVSGAGPYDYNAEVTITATPDSGYHFVQWSDNDTNASRTFNITANVSLEATFAINTYSITTGTWDSTNSTDLDSAVTITGTSPYTHGTEVTLTAPVIEGYTFDAWWFTPAGESESIQVSTSNSYTFDVTAAGHYGACYHVTGVEPIPADAVMIYQNNEGYVVNWEAQVNLRCDKDNVSTAAAGDVIYFEYDCEGDGGLKFSANTTALGENWWQDSNSIYLAGFVPSGSGRQKLAHTLTADEAAKLQAGNELWIFGINCKIYRCYLVPAANKTTYTVSVGSAANGSASADKVTVAAYENVTVTATANSGYYLSDWSAGGANLGTDDNPLVYNVTSNVTITPVFTAGTVTYKYQFESGSETSLSHSKNGIDFEELKETTYDGAKLATGLNDSAIISTVSHNFPTADTYRIDLVYYGNNDGDHSYTMPTIQIGDDDPVSFSDVSWTQDGSENWKGPYTLTVNYIVTSAGNKEIKITGYENASEKIGYDYIEVYGGSEVVVTTYTVSIPPVTGGTATGAGEYEAGSPVTLRAIPASGYAFKRWTVNGSQVSTNATYSFTATADVVVTPVFVRVYTITVAVDANGHGSVTGGGTYEDGESVVIKAIPDDEYEFSKWQDNNTSATRTITVSGDATYTATFVHEDNTRLGYTNRLRIEAESATLFTDASKFETKSGIDKNMGAATSPASFPEWLRLKQGQTGEAYLPFTVPADALTDTEYIINLCYAIGGYDRGIYVNLWIPDANGDTTINGSKFSKYENKSFGEFKSSNSFGEDIANVLGKSVALTPGTTYYIGLYGNEYASFDYVEIVSTKPAFSTDHTVTASVSGDAGATISASGSTSGVGTVFHEGETVTVTVVPSSGYKVAYWTVNDQRKYVTSTSYTIEGIYENTTIVATLTQSIDLSAVIKAADSTHPYAYAEATFPNTVAYANLYDSSNWEKGFDIIFSYDLKDASGNPVTFVGTATGSFIVEGESGHIYSKSHEGVANNEAAAISNCWYMGDDEVSAVKILLTELRYTNYNNGEYGDLDIGKTVNFHVLSIVQRDTPYVDLTNKTSNYIIYGNEIPVTNLGISGYNNNNTGSTINFSTVVDATNEFDNHRVWQIIYHLDDAPEHSDDKTGGINGVYAGRYYVVPDGDIAVDATGGSGFSFYYRTSENQTRGTWITMQSNLFTTHGANANKREPMKVYLEPTYGEWKAYYATYDLTAAAGEVITYWDFFIDGGDPCVEVPGGYLFDQSKSDDPSAWINSATDSTFWFSELRLERYKTVKLTYKDQFGKIIETRDVRLGSIQAPSTLTDREGYLFTYWTLDGDIVGPYWYFGTEGEVDSGSLAIPNAEGAYCYDDGHFNNPVTEERTYVAHYVYNGNWFNVTATNGTITTTNTKTGISTDPVASGSYDYETYIKLTANKDTSADFMYWAYGEYEMNKTTGKAKDSSGNDIEWDDPQLSSKKVYKHFAILSYKPTFSTNVMGYADYFAIYADDIETNKTTPVLGVVSPILAYYTPDKTGNGTGKTYRSTNTSKGTNEIYAYASMFSRGIAFDTYHDSEYNKLSYISTIAYKEKLYNPIGFGIVVTGYKASAQSILNADEDALLEKIGTTTTDEMAITYENFLSATTHFYTNTTPKRSIQEIDFKREDAFGAALSAGQFLTSITGLDNQTRRYARTFLIVEENDTGAVYVVYSDTYCNASIGSVPTQYTISANVKIGATAGAAVAVDTTTEGHTTSTASGNYITGTGSISGGMSGFLRAVAAIGYEFYGWDTNGNGTIDVETPLVAYSNLSGNLTYTAYFRSVNTVYVTATVATTNGGTIASSIENGQVNSGTTVYLYAMPNDGFTFVGWVKSSSELGISYIPESYTSTDAAYSFTATNQRTYVYAYFRSDTTGKATVRPIIGSVAGGTATVNRRSYVTVEPNTTVTFTATPKLGYSFVSWTIGSEVVSTNSTFNYTVTSTDDVIVTANFEAIEGLTNTKTMEAENYTDAKYNYLTGDVNASTNALSTDTDSDVTYTILSYNEGTGDDELKNKIVQLIPFSAPVAGTYNFKVYYKKANEDSQIYIDVFNTDDTTAYSEVTIDGVTYYETWYYGYYSGYDNENTTWGANSYDVQLTLAANEKILIGLCDNAGAGAQFDKVVVTCLDGNVFSTSGEVAQSTITFATTGGGTIYNTIDPDDTTTVLSGTSVDYNVGARVGMHAVPDAGKEFVGWSLDGGTTTFTNENVTKDTLYTHRVSSNETITAVFKTYTNLNHSHQAAGESYYTATITVENGNSATVKSYWASNSEAYYIDTVTGTQTMTVPTRKITLTAVDKADDGTTNVFAGWYQDGVFKTAERTFKTDYISGSTTIVAKYLTAADASDITLTAVGNGSILDDTGAVVTAGEFLNSSVQKFTAAPAVGYIFTGWSLDGSTPSLTNGTLGNGTIVGEGEYDLTVTENETIYAHFAAYDGTHTHDVGGETYYTATVSVQNGNTVIVKNYWSAASEAYYLDSTTSSMTITVPNRKLTLSAVDKVVSEGEINTFAGWYQDGVLIGMGEGADHTIQTPKKVKANTEIEARYVSALSLTASVNYYGAATISDGSTTASEITITPTDGTSYTFTAGSPANYYSFDGWYNGDKKVASTNAYTFTYDDADGSVELVAKYDYVSVDTMPIISIVTSDYATTNADSTQTSGFTAITKEYKNATVNVLNGDDYNDYTLVDASAKVKGRGNSSWRTSTEKGVKRAIRFKFDSKQNLLNINKNGTSKSWVLLANNLDRSLLRNSLAFELGDKLTNILYSSKYASVEVYINGIYQGVYLLCEQSEADATRANITEPEDDSDTTPDAFVELDNMQGFEVYQSINSTTAGEFGDTIDGDYCFSPSDQSKWSTYRNTLYVIASDVYSTTQYNYIKNTFRTAEGLVFGTSATEEQIRAAIDVPSFVDMYILQEIAKNADVGYSSFYFALKNGKIYCTTPWDFDKAFGADTRCASTSGLYVANGDYDSYDQYRNYNPWFTNLMAKDWFLDAVKDRWTALYEAGTFETVISTIEADYTKYAASYARNWTKWSSKLNSNTQLDNEPDSQMHFASAAAAKNWLADWYRARITYLNGEFNTNGGQGGGEEQDDSVTYYAVSDDGKLLARKMYAGDTTETFDTDGHKALNVKCEGEYGIDFTVSESGTYNVVIYARTQADQNNDICSVSIYTDGGSRQEVKSSSDSNVKNKDWPTLATSPLYTFSNQSFVTGKTYTASVYAKDASNYYKIVVTKVSNS